VRDVLGFSSSPIPQNPPPVKELISKAKSK
jgi:hypothetical protein